MALLSSDEITIQPPVGRESSYIQIDLAVLYHHTGANNQWMDLITNILPVDMDPDSDNGRIHQAKHLSEYQMQMGGLYVAAYSVQCTVTATLTFVFLSNKCF